MISNCTTTHPLYAFTVNCAGSILLFRHKSGRRGRRTCKENKVSSPNWVCCWPTLHVNWNSDNKNERVYKLLPSLRGYRWSMF